MKKLICLILCAVLLLTGCGAKGAQTDVPADPQGTDEEILAARRDIVEAEMREMMGLLWTPAEDITYHIESGSNVDDPEADKGTITFYAGKIYQGIPYTHGSGSGYAFLDYATSQDENGVYTISGLTGESLSGNSGYKEGNRARIGNDCADTLFWAWAQVSDSISFGSTKFMTEAYGCLKVGDYKFEGESYAGTKTANVCKATGEQEMFQCYAQMQKGDGMVLITSSGAGHAVMTVSVNVVYKDDGSIDGEASYVTILEQTSGCERTGEETYIHSELGEVTLCEILDKKWEFNLLFKKGYLPVTCEELMDASPREEVTVTDSVSDPTVSNMFTGTVSANYRISYVTITICDRKGNLVQEATCYPMQKEMYDFNMIHFVDPMELAVMQGSISLADLEAGNYKCTCTCLLSNGVTVTFRQFDFSQ